MNKLIEKIKDILHDSIDMVLVIIIFLAVSGTILWRLDVLFATDTDIPTVENPSDDDLTSEDYSNQDDDNIDIPSDSNDDSSPDNDNNDQEPVKDDTDDVVENNEPITVVIPSGSLAPSIGKIVRDVGLIQPEQYGTFLLKAQEMGLDTKFQSGTFTIERDASLETIIKIIARVQ